MSDFILAVGLAVGLAVALSLTAAAVGRFVATAARAAFWHRRR